MIGMAGWEKIPWLLFLAALQRFRDFLETVIGLWFSSVHTTPRGSAFENSSLGYLIKALLFLFPQLRISGRPCCAFLFLCVSFGKFGNGKGLTQLCVFPIISIPNLPFFCLCRSGINPELPSRVYSGYGLEPAFWMRDDQFPHRLDRKPCEKSSVPRRKLCLFWNSRLASI